jgi:hypothetical protein
MNAATGFGLYLLGSFVLVASFVLTPAVRYYLGAVVIFLFMGGVFYAWLNTIRQTNNMIKSPPPQTVQPKKQEEEEKKKVNEVVGRSVPPTQEGQQQQERPTTP